ncbi:MAG: prepilin peptidase [Candidatus Dactylopiibacterium carminicum]|uniref:prepilin peptidase n=1 Tax=Candidatus Dactylopiibacterium carminicum TaxID=857335 RepID=UPI000BDDC30B|nr:A24 family peptidase [Candidatus Dactylopiibacterium carminicum]PAS99347.1 MAG: prepilin peptidase [Candidatus Dactylopiibacterium carminicum]
MINLIHDNTSLAWLAALFGLCIGSFLNVVIHRLPRMLERRWRDESAEMLGEALPEALGKQLDTWLGQQQSQETPLTLSKPRSRCPHCGHAITALENIPVFSYLALRGRCRGCNARISPRYPLIELLTAALSAAAAWHFGWGLPLAGMLVLIWALIALAFIDLDTFLLPDDITLPLLWLGLLYNFAGGIVPLEQALIGAIAGYLSLWSVYWLFKLVTGKEGMGYGDFKLLAAIGAFLGWQILPVVILLSSVVGATVGILLIVLAKHGRETPIPFGPYLAAAGVLAIFFGAPLSRLFLP